LTTLRVENHDPVPLVTLRMLCPRDLEPVFIGTMFDKGTTWINPDGGVRYERVELNRWARRFDGRWYDLETGEDLNISPCANTSYARRLQPGERLVITHEA